MTRATAKPAPLSVRKLRKLGKEMRASFLEIDGRGHPKAKSNKALQEEFFPDAWQPKTGAVAIPSVVARFCVDEKILKARAFALYCHIVARLQEDHHFPIVPEEIEAVTGNRWTKIKDYIYRELEPKGFIVTRLVPNTQRDHVALCNPVPAIRKNLEDLASTDEKYAAILKQFEKTVRGRRRRQRQ